jgi:hypothetical protein
MVFQMIIVICCVIKNLIPSMLMLEDVCFRSWPCELGSLVTLTLLVIIF